ncbi:nuclear transport factor 2 family protein [Dietzia aurantiaca]|uniref:Nuclear transport factor 2 family protein n=1 Tax=Dietzia aurantiaca TaxID=983873 RepID=A0ABV9PPD2_9ACTN
MAPTQSTPESRLQWLVDEAEIRRLVTEYAGLVDAREWDLLVEVFAGDVVVDYHNGRTVVHGARNTVDYIVENTAHLAWQHHFVSPYGIDVDGDTATAKAYLLSHQMLEADPTQVLMMAATYDLEIRREDRWRISRMVHTIQVATYLPVTTSPPSGAYTPPAVSH